MNVRSIFVSEEEIWDLPKCAVNAGEKAFTVCLWKHQAQAESLVERARAHRFRLDFPRDGAFCEKRRIERLSAQVMLSCLLGESIEVMHEETGRPYLKNRGVEISISHTKGIYAVSLSAFRHGMDVEQWGSKALRVRTKFLSEAEMELLPYYARIGSEEKAATLLWSAKESVYKHFDIPGLDLAHGIQLSPLSACSLRAVLPDYGERAEICFQPCDSCVLTLCKPLSSDEK